MLVLLCLAVIGLAIHAVATAPADERRGRPGPLGSAAVVAALPATVLIAFVAPHLAVLAAVGLGVAWWVRARPALPQAPPRRPPRA